MAKYLLPSPGSVWYEPGMLCIPTLSQFESIERERAFNNPPSGFPGSFDPAKKRACLNPDGRLRISACAALILTNGIEPPSILLGQFDAGHPKMPGLMSVPGGAVDCDDRSLLAACVRELFEEIAHRPSDHTLDVYHTSRCEEIRSGIQAAEPHLHAFAAKQQYQLSRSFGLNVEMLRTKHEEGLIFVNPALGVHREKPFYAGVFPENDSLEICLYLRADLRLTPAREWVDSELLPNGMARNMPVHAISCEDTLPKNVTPKTRYFFELFQKLVQK